MQLTILDWVIIGVFFLLSMGIGVWVSRTSGKSYAEYFLSGRSMPWWLLGISMVATTFSADTPNFVTDVVRKDGISGNWNWWAFLLTGMLTVFVYARLWRKSGIGTDLEFYEMRYSGGMASFLRGFRAVYLGVFFNVMIMGTVMMAGAKIGEVLLGLNPVQTLVIASVVTVIYTGLGGLRGVILTDFFQFILAMGGTVWAAVYLVNRPEIGGLNALLTHEAVAGKLNLLPDFSDPQNLIAVLIIPLAVQWWSVWYPGAEPGGGGYVAQRMLSAKTPDSALGATLLFNIAHYALRPWPWILIALCSLVLFPDLASIKTAFPNISDQYLNDDMAYPAALSYLPTGLLGLVIASLIAAFMSTISTHLNWGASYVVNDVYKRFMAPEATEKELVFIGRLTTVALILLAGGVAYGFYSNALQGFNVLLQIGAGTGLIFILRWFWWRINAYTELTGMVVSFVVAIYFERFYEGDLESEWRLVIGVGITTAAWLIVTFLTRPTDMATLKSFYQGTQPAGRGWKPVIRALEASGASFEIAAGQKALSRQILAMFLGCLGVYSILFATGYYLYGQVGPALIATGLAIGSAGLIYRLWPAIRLDSSS